MFRILILLVLGVGVGYMLRGHSFVGVTKWSIQITVCALLFVFGVSIGSDRNLIDNLYNFGWQAAVIACLGVLGSIVAARVAQRLFLRKEENHERKPDDFGLFPCRGICRVGRFRSGVVARS